MKLLLITHETSRTGAPMVLLHFLRWLQKNKPDVQADVLTLKGGAMIDDFRALSKNFYDYSEVVKPQRQSMFQRVLKKIKLYELEDKKTAFLNQIKKNGYTTVYANTILTIPIGVTINNASHNSTLIAHIHELEVMIKSFLPSLRDYLPYISKIIAPSELVKQNLIERWDVQEDKIKVVYECGVLNKETEKKATSVESHFNVGASGAVNWRKGYDIFLLVAYHIKKHYPKARIGFTWVGKIPESLSLIIKEDVRKMELETSINFVGEVSDTGVLFNEFDVFLMPSREDPFPLVCIEVGLLGKPIISFEKAVGTNEILKYGGGFIVPYLDVSAMAEHVMMYYDSKELIEEHGSINKRVFKKFTPEYICPELFVCLE